MADLLSGETGLILGLLIGETVGILVCRWLWVNGQMAKKRLAQKQPPDHSE